MNERTLKLAANGLGEFFVHIYCADYSVCAEGPFASGEAAVVALQAIENGTYWVADFDDEG